MGSKVTLTCVISQGPHDLGTILDEEQVAIRAGHHCAQPLMEHLGVTATARASFGLYNDLSDVAALVKGLKRAEKIFKQPRLGSR